MNWFDLPPEDLRKAKKKYIQHKNNCKMRNERRGSAIEMRMTFEEWITFWLDSGFWALRGKGGYVMSRHGDSGHYEIGNVSIKSHAQNMTEAAKAIAKGLSRPCTVDGITIYPSQKELIKALGKGKTGSRSKSFRFVDK